MKLIACLIALTVLGKVEPIRLEVNPRSAFAPVTVRAKITIEPNYLNAAMCLSWDSEDGESGKTCRTIEGQYAAKVYWFDVPLRLGGEYAFQAFVAQGPKWQESMALTVYVIPRGEE